MSDPVPRSTATALVQRALLLFEQVLDLPAERRAAFLDEACGGSDELRAAVDELLAHHENTRFETAGLLAAVDAAPSPGGGLEGLELGDYRLLARAGMGGMGVVYRAEQRDPRRVVALKVVRVDIASDELEQRFRREVQLLAQLQHPGIAQVYDTGTFRTEWGALPYFAMEFVEGQPIDDFARERRLDVRARCALMIQICEAVQHAHERGVVHRDLKPGNLFVVALGEGRLQPKVLDFGIARSLQGEHAAAHAQTLTGQLLGTLGYMSPERAVGEGETDHRADVYSLGVVLYELLTGRLPYDLAGRSLGEVARILQRDEPERLGARDPQLRGDLETVVDKALARDLDRRYPSAAALAQDLQRYLDHRPVHSRPISTWYFLRKSILRHRALYAGFAATLLVLAVGLVTALWLADENEVLAGRERSQREKAEAASEDLRATLYRAEMRLVSQALADTRGRERARQLLAHWRPDPAARSVDLRDFEWGFASNLVHTEALVVDAPRDAFLTWSADGVEYAAPEYWVTLDPRTGEQVRRPRQKSGVGMRYTAARDLYVVCLRGGFKVARTADDEVVAEERIEVPNDVRISPDGCFVAVTAMPDGDTLSIYDVRARRYLQQGLPNTLGRRSFAFSHSSRYFAEAVIDGVCNIWTAPSFAAPRRIDLPQDPPHSMAWSRDDARLAIGYRNGPIDVFDVASGARVRRLTGHEGCVGDLAWSRDGRALLSSCSDSTVRVWDVETGRDEVLGGHHGDVKRVAWSPDERQVVSAGDDGTLRVFDVRGARAVRQVSADGAPAPRGLAWRRDGRALLVDHADETLHVDVESREVLRRIPGSAARDSASGRYLSVVRDGRLEVREVARDELVASVGEWGVLSSARWHPDDDRLAIAHHDRGVFEWRPGAPEPTQVAPLRRVHVFDWHPDGASLIGASGSVFCFRLRPEGGGWLREGRQHPGNTRLWASSPDGGEYAVQYATREFHVVELGTGEIRMSLLGHTDDGHAIAWNPAGTRIATAGRGGAVRLWDAATGVELFAHELGAETSQLCWHPDGDRLAVCVDGRVVVLDARAQPR